MQIRIGNAVGCARNCKRLCACSDYRAEVCLDCPTSIIQSRLISTSFPLFFSMRDGLLAQHFPADDVAITAVSGLNRLVVIFSSVTFKFSFIAGTNVYRKVVIQ